MSKKKPPSERVYNVHRAGDADTITARTRVVAATRATDLSPRQVWVMLELAVANGFETISRDRVYLMHGFWADDADMAHIQAVCDEHAVAWRPWVELARDKVISRHLDEVV